MEHDSSMRLSWFSVVVDCEDPFRLADFWCQVLGYQIVYQTDDIVAIAQGADTFPGIEFIRTTHHERRKSSLHLDLNPDDQDAEVSRLLALGARHVDVGQPAGAGWVVLADPEGNAFCVLAPQGGWTAPS
jgi:predicted enzyme related to lactoylglutathione lyase